MDNAKRFFKECLVVMGYLFIALFFVQCVAGIMNPTFGHSPSTTSPAVDAARMVVTLTVVVVWTAISFGTPWTAFVAVLGSALYHLSWFGTSKEFQDLLSQATMGSIGIALWVGAGIIAAYWRNPPPFEFIH